jgi:hypothetical protein
MKNHLLTCSAGLLVLMFSAGFTYSSYGSTSLNHCADVLQQQLSRSELLLQSRRARESLPGHDAAWAVCEPIIREVAALKLSH